MQCRSSTRDKLKDTRLEGVRGNVCRVCVSALYHNIRGHFSHLTLGTCYSILESGVWADSQLGLWFELS